MARLMLSEGMLLAFASATIVRRRGLVSGSPPPARAATVSSLMMRVKILPRLASAAPFLCLMECHLEWPDMSKLQRNQRIPTKILPHEEVRAVRITHGWQELSILPHARPTACRDSRPAPRR